MYDPGHDSTTTIKQSTDVLTSLDAISPYLDTMETNYWNNQFVTNDDILDASPDLIHKVQSAQMHQKCPPMTPFQQDHYTYIKTLERELHKLKQNIKIAQVDPEISSSAKSNEHAIDASTDQTHVVSPSQESNGALKSLAAALGELLLAPPRKVTISLTYEL